MKEKIQKSEALADFISSRIEGVKVEWENVKESDTLNIHLERDLHGRFFALKEVADHIRNSPVVSKKEHYSALDKCDNDFNKLVSCVNVLADAACRHDLHIINKWVNKWTKDDNTIDWHKILNNNGK